MITDEQIRALSKRRDELNRFIDIEKKKEEANALEQESQSSNFWENPKEAQSILKKLSILKSWIKSYHSVSTNIEELQY